MNKTNYIFISLLRSAITNTHEILDLADVNYEVLYSLARFHDLAHIVFYELNKRIEQWQGEEFRKFKQQYDMALYRTVKRDVAIEQIRNTLETAGISFVFLKGSFLMRLYPETWMRTSSDIDVLVEPCNYKRAIETLELSGLTLFAETPHDVSFYTQDKYHVELHHSLIEENRLPKTTEILEQVWQFTEPSGTGLERILSDEMLYFYHLAHMAKHVKKGGCGVRFFIDLWLLNHRTQFDTDKRNTLIRKSGLSEFTNLSVQLSEQWFSVECGQNDLPEYEDFIIRGGIYGSLGQSVAIRKKNTKNRSSYYLKRIFLPYNKIKYAYPILKSFPLLLPFCWVLRWLKLFNPKTRKKVINEVKTENETDSESVARVEKLMKQLKIY